MRRAIAIVGLCATGLAVASAPGCRSRSAREIAGGPIVKERRIASSPDVLRKVAVIPFYPAPSLGAPGATDREASPAPPPPGREETWRMGSRAAGAGDALGSSVPASQKAPLSRWEVAALVSNMVAEALQARGSQVVGPSDVELAFTGEGHPVPRLDPRAAVELSNRSFAATGVVLGKVTRYREREGGAAGATRPASVAFEAELYEVPSGRKLWVGRFDETQQSLTGNVFRARQYPGGGTRWLSAAEFARWGAQQLVDAMAAQP